jgi:hypothetical protein
MKTEMNSQFSYRRGISWLALRLSTFNEELYESWRSFVRCEEGVEISREDKYLRNEVNITFMGPCIVRNSNIHPTRCKVTQFILSGNCSTWFGCYHHPSSEAHTTVSTASGICHTVTATCRNRGRVGTGLSVLWVVYWSVFVLMWLLT